MKLQIKFLPNESQAFFYEKKFEVSPKYLNEPIQFKIKGEVVNSYMGSSDRNTFDIKVHFSDFELDDNYRMTVDFLSKIEHEILCAFNSMMGQMLDGSFMMEPEV